MSSARSKRNLPAPEALKAYVESGKSNGEIAELEGVSMSTVRKWIRENGLTGIRKTGRAPKQKPGKQEKKPDPVAVIPGHNADRHLCKTCQFRGWPEKGAGCEFIEHNPNSRRSICSVEDCSVYVKGPRLKKVKKTFSLKGETD